MKKGGFLILGLIALLLVGGLALASCRAGCEGNGTCEIKDKKGSFCSSSKCEATFNYFLSEKDGKCDC